jgi:hypothetical protein
VSTTRRFKVFATVAVLAGIGTIAAVLWHFAGVRGAHEGTADQDETAAAGSARGRRGCRFAPGQTLSYAVVEKTDLQVDLARLNLPPGAQLKGPPPSRTITVTLDLKALPGTPGPDAILLARYSKVDAQTTADAGTLTAPFLLRVNPACKITGYARQDTTAEKIARTQQAIAFELQWTWPHDGHGEADGENTVGRFRASFDEIRVDGELTVRRKILGFTELWSGSLAGTKVAAGPKVPRKSEMVVRPGTGPWFAAIDGHEDIAGFTIMDVKTSLLVRPVQTAPGAFADAPTDQARYLWVDLLGKAEVTSSGRRPHTREELALMEELRNLSLKEVLARYQEKLDRNENIIRRWPMLELYFEAHPELIKKIAKMLRHDELEDYMEPDMYLALGKVPTPEARDALLAINADRSAAAIDRTRAAFAILDREDVGVDFARTLQADAQAMNSGATADQRIYGREALLALGTMSGLREKGVPEIKAVAKETALGLLRAGKDEISLSPVFGTISNIGDPELLGSVAPYTRSPDPGVRAEASSAIRRMPPAETVAMTVEWLGREKSVRVKEALYQSITQQLAGGKTADPALVAQAVADLAGGPNAPTRQAIYKIIVPAAKTEPAAKAALIKQVKVELDAKEGLYNLLGEYLTGPEIAQGLQGR